MGVYDMVTLPSGPEGAQVKCWECAMRSLGAGSEVGPLGGLTDYAVALREGGYAVVRNGALDNWGATAPDNLPVFDKWGSPFSADSVGIMGEDYFWEEATR